MGWFTKKNPGDSDEASGAGEGSAAAVPGIVEFGDGFDTPTAVGDAQVAFGAGLVESELLPLWADIPAEFRVGEGRGRARVWRKFQSDWFYHGLSSGAVIPRAGIDRDQAWRHLRTIQSSWEPTHEHKQAAVAWLASRWFVFAPAVDVTSDRVTYTEGTNDQTGEDHHGRRTNR